MKRRWLPFLFAALLLFWLLLGPRLIDRVFRWIDGDSAVTVIQPGDAGQLGAGGSLFYSQGTAGVWRLALDDGNAGEWWSPPEGAQVAGLAASPDGARLVIALIPEIEPGADRGPSDLYITSTAAPDLQPLVVRETVGEIYDNPFWSPDGEWVYFTHFLVDSAGQFTFTVERIAPQRGGVPEVVIRNAYQPALSRDGTRIVYLGFDPVTYMQSLMITSIDGGGARQLLPHGAFDLIASPRFMPDGAAVIFSASGPLVESALGSHHDGAVHAHGAPWDVWRIPAEGGRPQPVTHVGLDGPWTAYEPGGSRLALVAADGVFVLEGDRLLRLADSMAEGEITWGR